jgi:hypothetical protein
VEARETLLKGKTAELGLQNKEELSRRTRVSKVFHGERGKCTKAWECVPWSNAVLPSRKYEAGGSLHHR